MTMVVLSQIHAGTIYLDLHSVQPIDLIVPGRIATWAVRQWHGMYIYIDIDIDICRVGPR